VTDNAELINEARDMADEILEEALNRELSRPGGIINRLIFGKLDGEPIRDAGSDEEMKPSDPAPWDTKSGPNTPGRKEQKLARYDLIPVKPLWKVAEVYGIGCQKYAERNWEKGYPWSKSYSALQRHLQEFWGGESYDKETKQHHLASVVFHCLALMEYEETNTDLDDRSRAVELESEVVDRCLDE